MLFVTLAALAIINGCLADIRTTTFTRAGLWCTHAGARIVTGDFDGDGKSDVLCYDNAGRHWIRYARRFRQDEELTNMNGWCTHGGSKRHVGDFNGDGRDDLMCHDTNGNIWISIADHFGILPGTSWHEPLGWCGTGAQLLIGDFNGDRKDDILCHHLGNGYKWVALAAEGHFFHAKTSWEGPLGWCYHPTAELLIGEFNGDGLADLLCHDGNGRKWIALAQKGQYFDGFKQTWFRDMNWCSHAGSKLELADINGDGRCDLVCHDGTGNTWTFLNTPGKFYEGETNNNFRFCVAGNDRFLIGNFLGDAREELLCTAPPVWQILSEVDSKK